MDHANRSHAPLTLKKAKAIHRRRAATDLSRDELRSLERESERRQRAEERREQEQRRKAAFHKRQEKEKREAEVRRRNGVGLATQLAGFSRTQLRMKNGMEAFVRLGNSKMALHRIDSHQMRVPGQAGLLWPLDSADAQQDVPGIQAERVNLGDEIDKAIPLCESPQNSNNPPNNATFHDKDQSDTEFSRGSHWTDDGIDDEILLNLIENQQNVVQLHSTFEELEVGPVEKSPHRRSETPAFPPATRQPKQPSTVHFDPNLDNFWESNTQISQELRASPCAMKNREHENREPARMAALDNHISEVETQAIKTGGLRPTAANATKPTPMRMPADGLCDADLVLPSQFFEDVDLMEQSTPPPVTHNYEDSRDTNQKRDILQGMATNMTITWQDLGLCTQDVHELVDDVSDLSDMNPNGEPP